VQEIQSRRQSFYALLGSALVKAASKMLKKLTTGVDFTKIFLSIKQKVSGAQRLAKKLPFNFTNAQISKFQA
jgi:hypothetical protein